LQEAQIGRSPLKVFTSFNACFNSLLALASSLFFFLVISASLKTTPLFRLLDSHYEEFRNVYEERFSKRYGYWRPITDKVVGKYIQCGDPQFGFARIRCKECGAEYLRAFSCKCAWDSITMFLQEALDRRDVFPGGILVPQTFGGMANWNPHVHALITDTCWNREGNYYPRPPPKPLEMVCEPNVDYIPWQDDVPEIEVG